MKLIGDNFDKNIKYRLFRNIKEIIHPTISKKNISSYKIIVDDNLLPLHIFYPDKVSNIKKVIIYIPGNGDVSGCKYLYSDICKDIAKKCDSLVVAIDYFEEKIKYPKTIDRCFSMISYLKDEFVKNGINSNSIFIMGDSTGANIICGINVRHGIDLKEILICPVVSSEYFGESKFESIKTNGQMDLLTVKRLESYMKKYVGKKSELSNSDVTPILNKDFSSIPNSLVITGDLDPLRDEGECYYNKLKEVNENSEYLNIKFATHGFIKMMDLEIDHEFYEVVNRFIDKNMI